ncbi:MAG: filamentous hemagglutinin N-terminal domain-containing protein [Nitrospirae bacterium]|nr:filamentous hemagglutinin N-terminal domain-containing protein [Nitrospirota bacterium]
MDEHRVRLRPPDSIWKTFLWAFLPTCVLVLHTPDPTYAQIATNITPTTTGSLDLGTDVNQVGTVTEITGGTRPGNGTNLFHSFDFFTLGSGDTAHFINDMQRPTTNIFGRVVGGEVSTIDGTVQTNFLSDPGNPMNFGTANLWLVNPSGVLLGPNAHIDVGGSVSFSTADYLRFENQPALFDMFATPASLDLLDVAPVTAFGFLGSELPAPITVQGSMLQVPEGQELSLVGGDIIIQAGTLLDGTPQAASLRAPGGQINLLSVASPGEVLVPTFQTDSFTSMGAVTIQEGALLDVGGQFDDFGNPAGNGNSGTVFVRGGQLVMDASAIVANTAGAADGANTAVDIQVSRDVAFSNGAAIIVGTSGSGRGGDVVIEAKNVQLSDFSLIATGTSGPGSGGDLFLNVGTLSLLGGSLILSNTTGIDLDFDGVVDVIGGTGGNVTVQGLLGMGGVADSVVLSGGSGITSEALPLSEDGGRISITATSLDLDEASSIRSSTTVTETDLDSDGVVDVTGRGGDIVVAVQRLSILGGASITSSTGSSVDGAAAGGTVTVQGLEGSGSRASSVVLSGQTTGIVSDSALGLPGDLIVNAGTLTITNGAVIAAGTIFSTGPAGNVTVTADSVVLSSTGQILSQSFAQDAGDVTISANRLALDSGSIVTSTLSGIFGRGGDVVLNGGAVSLTNGASVNSQSETFSNGRAGDITMNVDSLTLDNHAEITSSSKGIAADAGDAGNIAIHSRSTVLLNNSSITTEASEASGGRITVNAPEMIRLTNSQISTSVAGSEEDTSGGDISIDPQFVILQNSQILAQAFAGTGGNINIISNVFLADPSSLVDASSQLGISGVVNIQSPLQNVGGELTALTQEFSSAAALLAQQCAARAADGKFSTFVVAAREGLPMEPGGFLASPSLTAELLGSRLSGLDPQTQLSPVTGLFPKYDPRPIQLAKLGDSCHW